MLSSESKMLKLETEMIWLEFLTKKLLLLTNLLPIWPTGKTDKNLTLIPFVLNSEKKIVKSKNLPIESKKLLDGTLNSTVMLLTLDNFVKIEMLKIKDLTASLSNTNVLMTNSWLKMMLKHSCSNKEKLKSKDLTLKSLD